jgi:hypothetical protein
MHARARAAPLVDQRHHRDHVICGRTCLHVGLFSEFVRRRNHAEADAEIRTWAGEVEEQWRDRPEEPGDPFDFWRRRYDEKWPSTANSKPTFGSWRPKEPKEEASR